MTRRIYVLLILTTILFSCSSGDKIPKGILQPDKMQAVLWDMLRADVYTENFIIKDSSKNGKTENIKLQIKIFELNAVTKEEYYKSFEYYKMNSAVFAVLLDSLSNKVTREREMLLRAADDTLKNKQLR